MKSRQETKIELVAPAGNLEKLHIAFRYGANAVYLSGEKFGLRQNAGNFTLSDLRTAIAESRESGKKIYLALNIFPHEDHLDGIRSYCREIREFPPDAVIVSDIGTIRIVKEELPNIRIHISTQANTTNSSSASIYKKLGADRIILSRELNLHEISRITAAVDMEFEAFVHGAMCISYSGRCLLSSYLTGRDANLGDCAQPCRWEYSLVEKNRLNDPLEIEEDENGTYIMSSKDLCMLEHLPDLAGSGINAFKIEGRMRSAYYVASVTRAYREAIDTWNKDGDKFTLKPSWIRELNNNTTRGYTTGFYFGNPVDKGQSYNKNESPNTQSFLAIVKSVSKNSNLVQIQSKNRMTPGMSAEVMSFETAKDRPVRIIELFDSEMKPLNVTGADRIVFARLSCSVDEFEIIRKVKND